MPDKSYYHIVDGAKVARMRFALCMSQVELAKKAGISLSSLTRVERNVRVGDLHSSAVTLGKLAKALGVERWDIIDADMESFDHD